MRIMAENLGLSVIRSGPLNPCWTFEGERGGMRVRAQYTARALAVSTSSHMGLTVSVQGTHPAVEVRQRGLLGGLGSAQEVRLGDERVDTPLRIVGPPALLFGRMTDRARLALERLAEGRIFTVRDGKLLWSAAMDQLDQSELYNVIADAVQVASALRPGEDDPDEVLRIARTDPEHAVRLRALAALVELRRPALHAAMAEAADAVSLPAGPALAALLRLGDRPLSGVNPEGLRMIAELLPDVVARRLEAARDEASLIVLLGPSAALPAQIAAAQALGAMGTAAAVEPLLPLARGLLVDPTLKRLASAAVTNIQARLGQRERGAVTLTDTAASAGALALSGMTGELSLPQGRDPGGTAER